MVRLNKRGLRVGSFLFDPITDPPGTLLAIIMCRLCGT
jgi:hypothetical protein